MVQDVVEKVSNMLVRKRVVNVFGLASARHKAGYVEQLQARRNGAELFGFEFDQL